MNNLEHLKKLAEVFQTDKMITSDEIDQVLLGIASLLASYKSDTDKLNAEHKKQLLALLQQVQQEHNQIIQKVDETVDIDNRKLTADFDTKMQELKSLVESFKLIKPQDGQPGKDADELYIVDKVLEKIKLPEHKEVVLDDGLAIAKKLELLEGEDRIDAKSIKNLPDNSAWKGGGSRYLSRMADVRVTDIQNNDVLKWNATTGRFENGAGAGGTIDGSGTANELAYWVDSDTLGTLAVATYPSLTELSYVKGLTSAVQTQLNAKSPSTSPTFATSITGSYLTASEILITDGSKNIVSAPVATYPSLTELTYLKGVTSAIQTQINTKANSSGSLTQFVGNTAWRVFYSDGSGDIIELALGADGTFLKSNGAAVAPSFATPAGSGDVSKVGTPVNNQIGVWTGDGTLEGDADLTFDTTTNTLATVLITATTVTANLTGNVTGNVSGSAATVTTAAQPSITSLGTLTTLTVDDITINGNTISSAGASSLSITPTAGQAILLDGTISIDAGVVTGATSITSTTFVGALTGNASTASAVAVGGITGLGTNVATALAVNVGSAGAFVTLNGALGTPSSGTVTNLTGTASININGTVGATTPAAGTFTTLVAGSTTSLLLGTAGSAVGNIGFRNATSGTITLAPVTGALGTVTLTLPAITDTLVALTATQTLTNKTLTSPAITTASLSGTQLLAEGASLGLDPVASADGAYSGQLGDVRR
jgi:hypothetical protein